MPGSGARGVRGEHEGRAGQLDLRGEQQVVLLSEREEDEGELAALREQQPRAQRYGGLEARRDADERGERRLDGEERERRGEHEPAILGVGLVSMQSGPDGAPR